MNDQNPQHLRNLTLPFVAAITALTFALPGRSVAWWQLPIIFSGMAIWDLGWHSAVHHQNTWLARDEIRVLGPLIAFGGCLLSLVR